MTGNAGLDVVIYVLLVLAAIALFMFILGRR